MYVVKSLLGVTVLESLGVRIDLGAGKVEYSRPSGLALLVAAKG
jgi:hypothetical protein